MCEYSTQKEAVKGYPFIDSDAKPIIQFMLDQMRRNGRIKPKDRMLSHKDEIQLSRILRRAADKAGLNYGNKNVRFHCLRKFLTDRLSNHMSESKWKQIVGKKLTEGAYVSPHSLREDYQRVMVEAAFSKSVSEDEIELRAAQRALKIVLNKSTSIPEHTKEQMRKKIFLVYAKMDDVSSFIDDFTASASKMVKRFHLEASRIRVERLYPVSWLLPLRNFVPTPQE